MADDVLERLLTPAAPAAQVVRPPKDTPSGLRWEWNGNEGHIDTPVLTYEVDPNKPGVWDDWIRDTGRDPEQVMVVGDPQARGWDVTQDGNTVRHRYYRINLRARHPVMADLPVLLAEARRRKRKPKPPPTGQAERVTIVCWADPQTGKVARRGGTPELIERHATYQEALNDYLSDVKPDAAMLLDPGDAIEGFENVASQQDTNDLSLMDQVDLAGTLLFGFADTLAKRLPAVGVRGVGSNHCRWRKNKDQLGTPGDDWGLYLLKQLRKATIINPAAYGHVNVAWPDKWDETLAFEAAGYVVGMAHGHQDRPNNIPDWWARQTHGGQPIAAADILITGHYHHLRQQPSGRNPVTGRSKWWLQCPTADSGSDWYRTIRGDDSDPGVVVFTLERGRDGYPFVDLQIL